MFASKLGINNLTAILDYNNLQGYGRPTEICSYEPIIDKWKAFGWHVMEIDGHNIGQIAEALDKADKVKVKPVMIVANTITL